MKPFLTASRIHAVLAVSVIFTLIYGCSSNGGGDSAAPEGIDPSALSSIQLNLLAEITETDDFMPGRLAGLHVLPNGSVALFDNASNEIHQFDENGAWVGRVAGAGNGPGEIRPWSRTYSYAHGMIVASQDQRLHFFEQQNDGVLRFTGEKEIPGERMSVSLIHRTRDGINFFQQNRVVRDINPSRPEEVLPEFNSNKVFAGDDESILTDSLAAVTTHAGLIDIGEGNSIRFYSLPFRFSDASTFTPDGLMVIGDPHTGRLTFYTSEGEVVRTVETRLKQRPFSSADREFALRDIPRELHNRAMDRIRDVKPAFLRMYADDSERFWLRTDEGEEGYEYTVISHEGKALGRLNLEPHQNLVSVRGNTAWILSTPGDDLHSAYRAELRF